MSTAAIAMLLLASRLAGPASDASVPAKVAVVREPDSPMGAAVIESLVADPDDTVRFEAHDRPAAGSRIELARKLCAQKSWRGVYWFDTSRESEAWVVLFECQSERVRVREVYVDPAAEQAAIEEMWLIARGSATALVTGVAIEMDERDAASVETPAEEPKPPEPKVEPKPRVVPPPAPTRRRPPLRGSLAYAGDAVARALPWQHAIAAGFAVEPVKRLRVGIEYGFAIPATIGDGVRMWRHLLALQVGVFGGNDRVTAEGRAGIELELQRWRGDDTPSTGLRPVPKIGLDALLAIRLWRGLFLELGPGLAVPLARVDYVRCRTMGAECAGADRRVVLAAWPVRPRARVGLAVRF